MPPTLAKFSFSTARRNVLPPGAPAGRYWTHDFPKDIEAGSHLSLTLSDIDKQLIQFVGDEVGPKRAPKDRNRIPRSTLIELDYSNKIKALRLFLNMDASIAFVFGTIASPLVLAPTVLVPRETTLTTYYPSKRGKKILHSYYQGPGHPVLDIHLALTQYTEFFSIDTNSWPVAGIGVVSATAAIRSNTRIVSENACYTSSDMVYRDLNIKADGNPELYALWKFLTHLEELRPENASGKIGIITDTEYSLLKAINQRKYPIYRDYFMPPQFDLLYATADAGPQEFMSNSLIRKCDSLATEYLNEFLARNKRRRELDCTHRQRRLGHAKVEA